MALWIMLKSFKMGSHRILLFIFFYFISRMHYIILKNIYIQTYPRIGLFEKMMYRRIRIRQIPIHVSVFMLPRPCYEMFNSNCRYSCSTMCYFNYNLL
jgi:hypothetical protein